MLIADEFVYLHLPKTGGTFVREVLREVLAGSLDSAVSPELSRIGHHGAACDIPADHRGKPVLTTIRNPYDWYVSHYEFGWWHAKPGSVFDDEAAAARYVSYPRLSFAEFLEAFNDWRLWPAAEREGIDPSEYEGVGRLTSSLITTLAVSEVSPTVAALEDLRARGLVPPAYPELHFLTTTTLNADLRDFLLDQGFSASAVAHIESLDRIYPREGGRDPLATWESYYDAGTKAYVRERESVLFELFPEFDV